jgi:hypothetical protein
MYEDTSERFRQACLVVAQESWGPKGVWAYDTYTFINERYFFGLLPWPHIIWGLTPHGRCLALTAGGVEPDGALAPPLLLLHYSILGGTEKRDPWRKSFHLDPSYLGPALAFDVLLHECIHVYIRYCRGGGSGPTSHNDPKWVAEVNRLAPLLGMQGVQAGLSKVKRVPNPQRESNARSPATKVTRYTEGNIPFAATAWFPLGVRLHLGDAPHFYPHNTLPPGAPRLLMLDEPR